MHLIRVNKDDEATAVESNGRDFAVTITTITKRRLPEDIARVPSGYRITLDVPGYDDSDLHVEVSEKTVRVEVPGTPNFMSYACGSRIYPDQLDPDADSSMHSTVLVELAHNLNPWTARRTLSQGTLSIVVDRFDGSPRKIYSNLR